MTRSNADAECLKKPRITYLQIKIQLPMAVKMYNGRVSSEVSLGSGKD